MKFNYDSVDWTFVSGILEENSRRLSRTHQGKSDTGTSSQKRPLLLAGGALKERARSNERTVYRYIFENRHSEIANAAQVRELLLFRIADMTNDGLLPDGRFRTWPIAANQSSVDGTRVVSGAVAKTPPEEIPATIDEFCERLWLLWDELERDAVPVAAWAEWELNGGRLHPFYDGCGRISRSFAAALLLRGGEMLPLFDDAEIYFARGNQGGFVEYCLERIAAQEERLRGIRSRLIT